MFFVLIFDFTQVIVNNKDSILEFPEKKTPVCVH